MTQTPLKIFLGYVISMTLLWVFAACILSCEKQCRESVAKEAPDSSTELQPAPNCEDCPLNSFPKAAISQRLGFSLDPQAQALAPNSISSDHVVTITKASFLAANVSRLGLDPPLKRLPSLRI
jgi:hypothetical protein